MLSSVVFDILLFLLLRKSSFCLLFPPAIKGHDAFSMVSYT